MHEGSKKMAGARRRRAVSLVALEMTSTAVKTIIGNCFILKVRQKQND